MDHFIPTSQYTKKTFIKSWNRTQAPVLQRLDHSSSGCVLYLLIDYSSRWQSQWLLYQVMFDSFQYATTLTVIPSPTSHKNCALKAWCSKMRTRLWIRTPRDQFKAFLRTLVPLSHGLSIFLLQPLDKGPQWNATKLRWSPMISLHLIKS